MSMTTIDPPGPTLRGVTHHRLDADFGALHSVAAGGDGPPILLVHGFPETWWAFHKVIPHLATDHRVFAIDLPGFGDSDLAPAGLDSFQAAGALERLVQALVEQAGPVHLVGQDFSGATVTRLAASRPDLIRSLTAIEMGLPGFGLEALADVTHGGSWHVGFMAAPGIPEMLLAGRELAFLREFVFGTMTAQPAAVGPVDLEEFARTYARPQGWRAAGDLYRSLLTEGERLRATLSATPLRQPVLAIGAGGGAFTADTLQQVSTSPVQSVLLEGVGHYAALEAPDRVAGAFRQFIRTLD